MKTLADLGPLDSRHVAALDRIKTLVNRDSTPIEKELSVPLTGLLTALSDCEGRAGLAEILQPAVDHYMEACAPRLDLHRLKNDVGKLCR